MTGPAKWLRPFVPISEELLRDPAVVPNGRQRQEDLYGVVQTVDAVRVERWGLRGV